MIRSLSRYLFCALAFLLLAACDQNIECIEPDDWGQQLKYTISADNNKQYTVNPDHSQIGQWNNSNFILNGQNIVAVVRNSTALASEKNCGAINKDCSDAKGGYCKENSWTAWYGDWGTGKDGGLCQFRGGWCPTGATMDQDIPVTVVPCLFYRGLGLFAAISDNYQSSLNPINPFANNAVCDRSNLNNCFLHVGEGAKNPTFYDNYCPANGFMIEPPNGCKDGSHQCGINFKISDRYYNDNAGQYNVVFKQGVLDKSYTGPLSKFAQLVTGILCDATTRIYNTIVHESSFRSYVSALLILFIAVSGVSFIIGTSSMTSTELIIRVLKFGLITQLIISDTSWQFFNDYFFSFFTNGVGEITGILFGDAAFAQNIGSADAGKCAPNVAGIQAFDAAIAKLFSYETTRKIMSLLVWKIYGIFFIIAIYIMILIIIFTIVKALLIFFVSFLAISILIVLAPIFIPFMLFEITRSFFENWLRQLISHFIQPIIILTFAFFMMTLLMNQMEFLFGYRTCWKEWFEIPVVDIKFFAWQSDYDTNSKGCLPTPNSIYSEDQQGNYTIENAPGTQSCGGGNGVNYSGKCTPYACYQNRYIGFPYLDPNDDIDKDRINQLQSNELVTFIDLVILFVMVWFMVKFNKIVPMIAKRLSNNTSSRTSVAQAGGGMMGGFGKAITRGGYVALNPLYRRATGRDMREDAKALRKRVLFETDTDREKEMKELKDEHNKLISGLRDSAESRTRSIEEKTKDAKRIKAIKDRMETLKKEIKQEARGGENPKSFFARAADKGNTIIRGREETRERKGKEGIEGKIFRAPGKLPLKGITKVARKAIGKPTQKVRKFIRGDKKKKD